MATVSKTVPFGIAGSNPALGVNLQLISVELFLINQILNFNINTLTVKNNIHGLIIR